MQGIIHFIVSCIGIMGICVGGLLAKDYLQNAKMISLIIIAGIIGFAIGGVLVDLDHQGTWECKWQGFWGNDTSSCNMFRGIMHKPLVVFSIITFFSGLATTLMLFRRDEWKFQAAILFSACIVIGIVSHTLLDYLYYIGV